MIENCSWKFEVQCPRLWANLRKTDDPDVRLCETCLELVYLCRNDAEVAQRAAEGKCVAAQFFRDDEMLGRVITK
jgi:hypothetical protein